MSFSGIHGMPIDEWFRRIREKYSAEMQCGKGCTACCYGLFEISLADAAELTKAYSQLPEPVQKQVSARASAIHNSIRAAAPDLPEPLLLSDDDERIDIIVDAANSPRCPLLFDSGECLVYDHRPLSCRLEGVPMVDMNDEPFGDWCELNFKHGLTPAATRDLRQDYDRIASQDESRSAAVAERAGIAEPRAVTFIPSAIAEFPGALQARSIDGL